MYKRPMVFYHAHLLNCQCVLHVKHLHIRPDVGVQARLPRYNFGTGRLWHWAAGCGRDLVGRLQAGRCPLFYTRVGR